MSEPALENISDDEISLQDILDFLAESWKSIALAGLLGVLGATGFIWVTPNQYQATAQIKMAQINRDNDVKNNSSFGINVESPSLLIARHKIPSTYGVDEIKACGLDGEKSAQETLAKIANFTSSKGIDSVVNLEIRLGSKEESLACALALFENIKESQGLIMKPYVDEAKTLLIQYQARLKQNQEFIAKAERAGSGISAAYLSSRDEIVFLNNEISRLTEIINSPESRPTRLISPIYASDLPVFPEKTIILVLGLFLGILTGIFRSFLAKFWSDNKSTNK